MTDKDIADLIATFHMYADNAPTIPAFTKALAAFREFQQLRRTMHIIRERAVARINGHQEFCVLCQSPVEAHMFQHESDCPLAEE